MSADAHEHHDPPFWKKYIFSTDHKVIGLQYGFVALTFLAIGFFLMMVMRWSIAFPDRAVPMLSDFPWFQAWLDDEGKVTGELYNMFGAMHGTIMVFLGVVPLAFGAFGNYVTPLQIGAPDMAFPRLNMASFWSFLIGGIVMLASFFLPSGAAKVGWTNYSPLATTTDLHFGDLFWTGQTLWLVGMVFLISSSLLGAVNFITTIINLRCRGMTWMRMPFFVWAMLVTGFLLLLAFPPLEVAAIMQLMDRMAGTSFFVPTGLNVNGAEFIAAGGGSPLLYQHLFWFLGHPEVYVLVLPAIAIVGEIIPCNTRKPLWGYKTMVYAVMVLGFLSFIVWAHHMYMTGMGPAISTFFQTTTVLISVPSVILITSILISMWGGSIRFTIPMLFATAFIPMFGFGGLTGLPLAFSLPDLHLHDTYYVIGHFHYVVAPGTIFGLFAGIYHWYPKHTGRQMNTMLGHLHFWPSLLFMNGIFLPMMLQGMAGFHRRAFDGGKAYEEISAQIFMGDGVIARAFQSLLGRTDEVLATMGRVTAEGAADHSIYLIDLNIVTSTSAWLLAVFQAPFIINIFWSAFSGKKIKNDNPWDATTLEWSTPTPPPHGNFIEEPVAYRDPYEYSVPGADTDFTPQFEPDAGDEVEETPNLTPEETVEGE
ncbi:cbb3-type cytochrome c oxidase subunit I [Verrucomicrobiales bacterium]|nr:cbb3-type cytochrome c oxidase subunit I [Verrucomicrobiales bacterium]MDB4662837.1 cbb3-type cytochrome c oxidase subunit I [Verrucomicrobiales bacterium]MDC0259249.1 cbb3-type cytochrome c oxidase subunit I [Verrucomicrobiales bacterium]MDC0322218.1 cbb3-type cytochrome c oxidase subunit I [Verrucomicrobiales bacterium]